MMKRWLARLAFSFIVVAVVLAWEGRRAAPPWHAIYLVIAGVLLVLGLIGLRERHRR